MGMTIYFKNKTIEKQFSSKYKKNWRYPEQVKKKLLSTENFIQNAAKSLQGIELHMIPCDDEGNEIIEGDIMAQCKTIKIVKVMEVSNHYE